MAHGRSIRIYLADGSASGIRHAEVVNWTGQAIVCPRSRVAELKHWDESQRPGVYMLVGDNPDGPRPLVYVGEAENVHDRLKAHFSDAKKEFWDQVVLFSNKDANLTKAHVKYLESRIVELMGQVGRVALANGNSPPRPSLPRADRDAMEEFLGPARLLLAALGFTWLQPLTKRAGAGEDTLGPSGPLANTLLHFTVAKRGVEGQGYSTDEGFVVLAGSVGAADILPSLSNGWKVLRGQLVSDGAIESSADSVRFTRDVLFASPSAGASVLVGGARNGRLGWRDEHGVTLRALEESLAASEEATAPYPSPPRCSA